MRIRRRKARMKTVKPQGNEILNKEERAGVGDQKQQFKKILRYVQLGARVAGREIGEK